MCSSDLNAEDVDPKIDYVADVKASEKLNLGGIKPISFLWDKHFILEKKVFLPEHSNGMKFVAKSKTGKVLLEETYFSVGGGTIARADEISRRIDRKEYKVPYQFNTCKELMKLCDNNKMTIAEIVLQNERAISHSSPIKDILKLDKIMQDNIDLGLQKEGYLRGGLKVKRHAKEMYERLLVHFENNNVDSLMVIDWINIWAMAVAEENAAGGKMVTAPTMGSAGIIPAVMRYMKRFGKYATPKDMERASITFMATASAICSLKIGRAHV